MQELFSFPQLPLELSCLIHTFVVAQLKREMAEEIDFVLSKLSALSTETRAESAMLGYLRQILTLLHKYEDIWSERPNGKTRNGLKELISIFERIASADIKVRLASRLMKTILDHGVVIGDAVGKIRIPPKYTATPKDEVIADRNRFKNRFGDLLESVVELQEEIKFVEEVKEFAESFKDKPQDAFAKINELNKKVQETDVNVNIVANE